MHGLGVKPVFGVVQGFQGMHVSVGMHKSMGMHRSTRARVSWELSSARRARAREGSVAKREWTCWLMR